MMSIRILAILLSVGITCAWQKARDTVAVEFAMTPADSGAAPGERRPGEAVAIEFRIKDKVSGSPLSGKFPSAWIDSRGNVDPAHPATCRQRVQRLLNADVFARAEVDLNSYYVMALNDDATVTVVDPEFGYGNTRLLALVALRNPGADWALTSGAHPRLFVSMPVLSGPAAAKIAVIDTALWRVVAEIDSAGATGRLALQPDGRYLWVAAGSQVLAIDTENLRVAAQIETGPGPHHFAFTPDSRIAFVANEAGGSVSIIDTGALKILRQVSAGPKLVSIAFSAQSRRAYTIDGVSGDITVIDWESNGAPLKIHVAPGLNAIRFAREGRFGFVLNRVEKRLYILDTSTNRVIQTTTLDHEPDQIAFSDTVGYIRQVDSDAVLMVPLDAIGIEGKAVPVADFTGGQHPPGQAGSSTPPDGIVRAPGENAVLVANPGDKAIYYYSEGMAAPMGFFSNYSRAPKAVLVLDRSLRQTMPGTYRTISHLPRPGLYTMAFLLDNPPAVQCWDFEVRSDPGKREAAREQVTVESLNPGMVSAGGPVTLRFRIRAAETGQPMADAADVIVQAYKFPGTGQQRFPAKPVGGGIYEAQFVFAKPGTYRVHLMSVSLGLQLRDFHVHRYGRGGEMRWKPTAPMRRCGPKDTGLLKPG